jgi:hypothetical protein
MERDQQSQKAADRTVDQATEDAKARSGNGNDNAQASRNRGTGQNPDQAQGAVSEAAEGAQAMFGNLRDGADAALERNAQLTQQLSEVGKRSLEAVAASSKVLVRGVGILSREAAEYGRKNAEDASGAIKRVSQVRNPAELLRLHSEFAQAVVDNAVGYSTRMSEAMIGLAGEMAEAIAYRQH